jgi:glycosyltransferase involved in cell wall biosynthesis
MSESDTVRAARQVFCLVPVKNEEWILDAFIRSTSQWADHIIIADQNSTDGSAKIAAAYPKVSLVANDSAAYGEDARQKLLINEARKFPGEKVLVALDADELFSSGFQSTQDWKSFLRSAPGTVGCFLRAELLPGMRTYYGSEHMQAYAFVDNGEEHVGRPIHSHRVPMPRNATSVFFKDFVVLHFQNVNEQRMESKQRWYKCWERLKYPDKRAVAIMRLYERYRATAFQSTRPVPAEWLTDYESIGISALSDQGPCWFWWDDEVAAWIEKHGRAVFRDLDIWDQGWVQQLAAKLGSSEVRRRLDPRSPLDRAVHFWMHITRERPSSIPVRIVDRMLGLVGY